MDFGSLPDLPFVPEEDERAFFEGDVSQSLPFRISSYITRQLTENESAALRRQFIPRGQEYRRLGYESADPLSESRFSPLPRLVHRYPDRVLIQVTGQCAAYCRHCFRRNLTGGEARHISREEISRIADYLAGKDHIREILFSGGDPLMLPDDKFEEMLSLFRAQRPERLFRIATRIPVVDPEGITPDLVNMMKSHFPLWCVVQINHPDELTDLTRDALRAIAGGGIPVLSQSVLLKDVNDNADILEELFSQLPVLGVKPYYLFQGDLASGTSHFRVSLKRGMEIVKTLRSRLSGLAMPVYAVDLPGGGGKIPLTESYLTGETESSYLFRSVEGTEHSYPKE